MTQQDSNVKLVKHGEYIKQSVMKGSILNLLVEGNGIEISHYKLEDGRHWLVGPTEGWNGLEFVYLLSGSLSWEEEMKMKVAQEGDHIIMNPIQKDTMFKATGETNLLYISSQSTFDMYDEQVSTFMDLAIAVEEKDGYTSDHCSRITTLSMQIGEKLKLATEEMYTLHVGSFLHDVGKIKIPDGILNKPAKLSENEYELMKKHSTYGADMLRNSGIPILKKAADIVEQHHERYDGSGYPFGLKGKEISLLAQIVAVADSFDAMTSNRIYSKGRSIIDAIEEIKRTSGKLYNPDVVNAFLIIMSQIKGEGEEK
jgi:putative nucleotidyltransferase with HDIG domain